MAELSKSRDFIRAQLDARLAGADGLSSLLSGASSEEDLVEYQTRFKLWDDYNNTLLTRLFSSGEIVGEYGNASAGTTIITPGIDSLRAMKEHEADHLRLRRTALASIRHRLELFSAPTVSASEDGPGASEGAAPSSLDTRGGEAGAAPPSVGSQANRVFVVHGRNLAVRDAMFQFLRSIGLRPIEWSEAVSLTGAGSPYVGDILDEAFDAARAVVVVLSPDDEVRLSEHLRSPGSVDPGEALQGQARPNVLFEAGMAFGRNPDRTLLVEIGAMRPFSDIGGRHTIRLDDSTQRRQELAQRLRDAGCSVDLEGTDWHSAGDFAFTEAQESSGPAPTELIAAGTTQPSSQDDVAPPGLGNSGMRPLYWESNPAAETGAGLVVHNLSREVVVDIEGQRVLPNGTAESSTALETLNPLDQRGINPGWRKIEPPPGAPVPTKGTYSARVRWTDSTGTRRESPWRTIDKR